MGWGYSPLFHMTSKVALRLIPTGWPEPLSPPLPGPFPGLGYEHGPPLQTLCKSKFSVKVPCNALQTAECCSQHSPGKEHRPSSLTIMALLSVRDLAVGHLPQTWYHQGLLTHHQGPGLTGLVGSF